LVENLKQELAKHGLSEEVEALVTGCFGFCEKGPIVTLTPSTR
jgi:NADH:ubiquinone oxidoreductase subunit E